MKFKDGMIIMDATVHPVRIITSNAGTAVNITIDSGIASAQSISTPNGGGMTVVQNGVWVCYYGVNDVFSCRDESSSPSNNNHFDHDDDNAGASALAIVDIAGDCVVAAA